MPQASDELRAEWPGGDYQATQYLADERGFMLTRRWTWVPPTPMDYKDLSEREYSAILYLVHEWDYGGLEGGR